MSCSYKEDSYSKMLSEKAHPKFWTRQHFLVQRICRIWSTGKAILQSRLPGGALNWQVKLACYFSVWFTKRIQLPQASRDWPIWEEERWHLKAALKSFLGSENGKQKFDFLTKSLNECLYLPSHDFTHSESTLSHWLFPCFLCFEWGENEIEKT